MPPPSRNTANHGGGKRSQNSQSNVTPSPEHRPAPDPDTSSSRRSPQPSQKRTNDGGGSSNTFLVADEEELKQKFQGADKVFNRLMWDKRLDPKDFDLGYEDRFKGILFRPVLKFRNTGDEVKEIPFHRVRFYRYKGMTVWDREKRVDRLDEVYDSLGTAVFGVHDTILRGIPDSSPLQVLPPGKHIPTAASLAFLCPSMDDLSASPNKTAAAAAGSPTATAAADPFHPALSSADNGARVPAPGEGPQAAVDSTLTFLTYNILHDIFDKELLHTSERLPCIVRILEESNADVIALQEVTPALFQQLRELGAGSSLVQHYFWTSLPENVPSAQIILSKHRMTEAIGVAMSKNKRCVVAAVHVNLIPIIVANCHLISDYAGEMVADRRINEIRTIFRFLNNFSIAVLLGDFNFGDESVEQNGALLSNPGWQDCFMATRDDPSDPGFTFDLTTNPLADLTSKHHRYPRRLDRILVRGLEPMRSCVFGRVPFPMMVSPFASTSSPSAQRGRRPSPTKESRSALPPLIVPPPPPFPWQTTTPQRLSPPSAVRPTHHTDPNRHNNNNSVDLGEKAAAVGSEVPPLLGLPQTVTKQTSSDTATEQSKPTNITTPPLLFASDHYGLASQVRFAAGASLRDDEWSNNNNNTSQQDDTSEPPAAPVFSLDSAADRIAPENFFPYHRSALVVILPPSLHSIVDEFRQEWDKAYPRWMPHITIMFPFVSPQHFSSAIPLVERALTNVSPFSITLRKCGSFENRKTVVFLEPETAPSGKELHMIEAKVAHYFFNCKKSDSQPYSPHVTLGQVERTKADEAIGRVEKRWSVTQFTVRQLHLIAHLDDTPRFEIMHTFQLQDECGSVDASTGGGAVGGSQPECTSSSATTFSVAPVVTKTVIPIRGGGSSSSVVGGLQRQEQFVVGARTFELPDMVLEDPTWGNKMLEPYLPQDALELWMLRVSVRNYARSCPTHISQLGGMYHIPSDLLDPFLLAWEESYALRNDTPFYMEEIRGNPFRLYLDLDFKRTIDQPFDASDIIVEISKFAGIAFGSSADALILSLQCHTPWEDAKAGSKFKSGFRLYFQRIFVDQNVFRRFHSRLLAHLRRTFGPNPPSSFCLPPQTSWTDICDETIVTWERGRLIGTIKRRKHLQRVYTLHGLFTPSGRDESLSNVFAQDVRRVMYGQTLRVWDVLPSIPGVLQNNAFRMDRLYTANSVISPEEKGTRAASEGEQPSSSAIDEKTKKKEDSDDDRPWEPLDPRDSRDHLDEIGAGTRGGGGGGGPPHPKVLLHRSALPRPAGPTTTTEAQQMGANEQGAERVDAEFNDNNVEEEEEGEHSNTPKMGSREATRGPTS